MSEVVLDASAVLALLDQEPGAQHVAAVLPEAMISAINFSETVAKLSERAHSEEAIRRDLENLSLAVLPFEQEDAYQAGLLRRSTRHLGLSFGDRACIGLAMRVGLPVLTAERIWARLDVGIEVRVIR